MKFLAVIKRTAWLFSFIPLVALANTNEAQVDFQKGLACAKSNLVRDKFKKALLDFKPQEVFKNQKGGYTKDPLQTSYYSETQSNAYELEKASREEVAKDEDVDLTPTPGKLVTTAFVSRPIVKINPKEEFMQKGKLVMDNASNVVAGESNKYIDCEKQKMAACKTIQVEKMCNEEVRTIRRICEEVPNITISTKEILYPSCKSLVVTQGEYNGCPAGYSQILYVDMVKHTNWDDMRFCARVVSDNEASECFSGAYYINAIGNTDAGRVIVPQKMHSRIRFSNVYYGYMVATIINETTGKTLYSNAHFGNGHIIELPFSEVQDQTFRFYDPEGRSKRGVMVLYIDHIAREKLANEPIWQESCRDI